MGEWRKVTSKEEAVKAKEDIIDSENYKSVLLVWWTPKPSDDFIKEAEDRSTVTAWRAGIWIKEEIELPEELRKDHYNVSDDYCAVMLKLTEHFDVVESLLPDDDGEIDPAFLK